MKPTDEEFEQIETIVKRKLKTYTPSITYFMDVLFLLASFLKVWAKAFVWGVLPIAFIYYLLLYFI